MKDDVGLNALEARRVAAETEAATAEEQGASTGIGMPAQEYRVMIEVEGALRRRHDAVVAAVRRRCAGVESSGSPGGKLEFGGRVALPAAASPRDYARDLALSIWGANLGYCLVWVYTTRVEDGGRDVEADGDDDNDETIEFDEEAFEAIMEPRRRDDRAGIVPARGGDSGAEPVTDDCRAIQDCTDCGAEDGRPRGSQD